MAKVTNIAVPIPEQKENGQLVGLSNCPNLTAKFYLRKFINDEVIITLKPNRCLNLSTRPPIREGELIQNGLTLKGARMIKKATRMLQYLVESKSHFKSCVFITLVYPNDYPDDKTAKKHLDNFFKRLNRKFKKLLYLWVAERQKRGAIHFHILTTQFVAKEYLNQIWSEIVEKWHFKMNIPFNGVYPNVQKVYNASAYLAKYLTKSNEAIAGNMYGISMSLRELLKPISEQLYEVNESDANKILLSTLQSMKQLNCRTDFDFNGNLYAWLQDGKDIFFRLNESINNYKL